MTAGRIAQLLVAIVAATLGLFLAQAHLPSQEESLRFAPLAAVWLVAPLALLFEPAPGARVHRTAAAVLAASAVTAALTLALVTRSPPPWWTPEPTALPLGLHLTCLAWTGRPVGPWLVLTLALLPAPLALLLVRRVARQLEWQVAATALGPPVVAATLYFELAVPARLWLLALAGAPIGVGAYVVDRHRLGAGIARPARRRAALLAALLAACAAWTTGWSRLAARLLPEPVEAGCPDLTPVLEDVRARQEAHRARVGVHASSLVSLAGIAPDVAGGYTQEHVLRFALTDGTWVLTADPVPARLGWPSLRLVGPSGEVERGPRPFALRVR